MVAVDFRINRFRRDKHECVLRGFTGDDVFLCNGIQVRGDIAGELSPADLAGIRVRCFDESAIALEGELGVNNGRSRRVRQFKQAIRPFTVAECCLKLISPARERVRDQFFKLKFAKGAAGLFVVQNAPQTGDLF